MRRLPPQQVEMNLSNVIDLVPELCEDLLAAVDQPLRVLSDKETGKDYLLCDYNRDGDSYRLSEMLFFNLFTLLSMCYFSVICFNMHTSHFIPLRGEVIIFF